MQLIKSGKVSASMQNASVCLICVVCHALNHLFLAFNHYREMRECSWI